ncbi:MAG: carboxypeptidase-like regulatory domain-containing protein [Chitinophagaceae bacterium]
MGIQKNPFLIFGLVTALVAVNAIAAAQAKFTLNGYVKDSASGESIIGATITVYGQTKGVSSNQYGFYSITLDKGIYDISISHISYLPQIIHVDLSENKQHNFDLNSRSGAISEVIVFTKKRDANVKNAQMGKVDLSIEQIKNIPAFMGEVDILKAIQLLPGVRNAGEGNAGFYVRGGDPIKT